MKLTVTVELDQDAYDKAHGPGSDWWAKYHKDEDPAEYWAKKNPNWLEEGLRDCLEEGFYDWSCKGWMKLQFQG